MDTDCDRSAGAAEVPGPAGGVEFLGRYQGSGFREPRFLLRRADGQVAQVPELLYVLARAVDGRRSIGDLAALARDRTRLPVTDGQVRQLVDDRLRPAGLTAADPHRIAETDGRDPPRPAARGDHLLMLRLRTALVPEAVVHRLAGPLRPLFHPVSVAVVLLVAVGVDAVIVTAHGWEALLAAGDALAATPALTLAVLGLVVAAGAFHEVGHVTACRYGGARPGVMGVGVYLVWPAFYSTVTDAYRLSRGGRLRTDLGGVYFNTILLACAGGVYLVTGWPWLLAFAAFWHAETAWQFLPSLRLDGYYVLADLVGIPDLFNRIRPVLRGLFRRDHADPLVADLKPWVRWVVTTWVVLVVPFLLYWVGLFAVLAPQLAPSAWRSLTASAHTVFEASVHGRVVTAAAAAADMVLLGLPWAAGTYLVYSQLRRIGRWLGTRRTRAVAAGRPAPRGTRSR